MLLPPGSGPYDHWELMVEETGELVAQGSLPYDHKTLRKTCAAFHKRAEAEMLAGEPDGREIAAASAIRDIIGSEAEPCYARTLARAALEAADRVVAARSHQVMDE